MRRTLKYHLLIISVVIPMLGLFSQKFCPDCVTALMFSEGSMQGAVINKKPCCNSTGNWINKGRWLHNTDGDLACKIEYTYQNEYIVSFSYQPEGGNGYFTQLLHIKDIDNQYVLLNPIARGDRCMGGVDFEKISVKGDYLYYSIHVAYFDVLTWAKNTTEELEVNGCPACCDGIANYKYNPRTQKKELINFVLDAYRVDEDMKAVMQEHIKSGKIILK